MFTSIRPFTGNIARRIPLIVLISAVILFLALGGGAYVSLSHVAANARWLHEAAARWGILAALLFVVFHAAMLMLLVIPAWLCAAIAGLLFGPWLGALCGLAGASLGATGVFLVMRAGLIDLADAAGPRVAGIAAGFRASAFRYLLVLRLVPVLPFTMVNIAAALAGIPLRSYVFATAIGTLPSVLIYASLGDLFMDLVRQGHVPEAGLLQQPRLLLPMLGLGLLAWLSLLLSPAPGRLAESERLRHDDHDKPAQTPEPGP